MLIHTHAHIWTHGAFYAGGGRGSSRVHQVCYLFHPFQPFMLAVVQDLETGQPEGATAFARLA
jgi:hypothetical protein